MNREQVSCVDKGNMSALKELVDVLTRYYLLLSEQQNSQNENKYTHAANPVSEASP